MVDALRKFSKPKTTNRIAEKAEVSWHTAKLALELLYRKGYVRKGRTRGNTTYWQLIR